MKHLQLNLLALTLVLLVLSACNKATYITPDKAQLDFTIEGGEENVIVSTDGSWEIKACPEWVTTELQENTLVVKVPHNDTGDMRRGNIVLASGDVRATIAVKQMTLCTHITPESDTMEFDKTGGTQTMNIDTDGALQVTTPEGFTARYAGGVLTVTTSANEGGKRSGQITLTADGQTATIAVTQAGNICPKCNGTGKVKCAKCGGRGYTSDYARHGGEERGCTGCGGSGYRYYSDGWADMSFTPSYENHGFRKGSGKVPCPECGGSGS